MWASILALVAALNLGQPESTARQQEEMTAWLKSHLKEEFDPDFVPWNWHDIKPRNARDDHPVLEEWKTRAQTAIDSGKAAGVSWRMKNGEGSELEGIMAHEVP